jgi:hypothetical protein
MKKPLPSIRRPLMTTCDLTIDIKTQEIQTLKLRASRR